MFKVGRIRKSSISIFLAFTTLWTLAVLPQNVSGEAASSATESGREFAASIDAGQSHVCALISTGDVRCWGENRYGQLGNGNVTKIGDNEQPWQNVNLGGLKVSALSSGIDHTCALLQNGKVRCWGENGAGQLGLGNTITIGDNENPTTDVNLGGATAIAISTNGRFTCAILNTGNVRCWGDNGGGTLGLGNTTDIGDDENPTDDVNLGGETATAISAGFAHACAILSSGNVRCWGQNTFGQLGLGNTTTIGDNESPSTNVNLGGVTVKAVSVGAYHTCVILAGGNVRCWGLSTEGQLGIENTATIGDNESPTVNVNLGPVTAIAISTTGYFTCVVTSQSQARCWGKNWRGWLGRGDAVTVGDNENPAQDVNLGQVLVSAISSSDEITCVLIEAGLVRCWGDSYAGGLGLGNTATIGDDESPTQNVSFFDSALVGPTTSSSSSTSTSSSSSTSTSTSSSSSTVFFLGGSTTTFVPSSEATSRTTLVPSSEVTSTTNASSVSSGKVLTPVIRVGKSKSFAAFMAFKNIAKPKGSRTLVRISAKSAKVCKTSSTSIRGLRKGKCTFTLSIVPIKGKTKKITFNIAVK